jgi:hypothetical protein
MLAQKFALARFAAALWVGYRREHPKAHPEEQTIEEGGWVGI